MKDNSNHQEKETKVTILGSGTCVPSLKRSSCSVLVKAGGSSLLLDIGPGTIRRLLETGTTIFDVSYIFISHFHPDHIGELAAFLFSTKYPKTDQRKTPLTILAGRGFNFFFKKLKMVYGQWIELGEGMLKIIELDNAGPDYYKFEGFTVESAPVVHNDESLGYKITCPDGKSIVYSGDTDFSDNLAELAGNADLFICESALPDDLKVQGHLTPSIAGEIASRANVKKLVLTHFYPECDLSDIRGQCRKTYSGPLILAEDLMEINVRIGDEINYP